MVNFGQWEEAPLRKTPNEFWYFSGFLRNTVGARPYSRSCWHQEYSWNVGWRKYNVRGFWATKDFKHPLLVNHPSSQLMMRNSVNSTKTETCLFGSLPKFPPSEGFFPEDNSLRLTFVQVFFKTAAGVFRQAGSWQLVSVAALTLPKTRAFLGVLRTPFCFQVYNVELSGSWKMIGPEGYLAGDCINKSPEENCADAGAEESEEDWF
ncbi:uncharacterized protein LOC122504817 [Leptopilina heterotoma]|uniref:uncharacterized protein LOC122504817 n=1 Tax=Leptopilina heterotoma TaxID=63436 RepID=UPI001CA7EBD9|nr:uncharacterized protein LOC122504817 [Leptopilina heterotoma]